MTDATNSEVQPQVTENKEELSSNTETPTIENDGPDLSGLLFDFPGAPTKDEVEEWKALHGDVLCSGFSETELYVFRPLTRAEWLAMQAMAQQSEGFDVEQEIVDRCLLWATENGKRSLNSKAGSLTTLHEQIMQQSNFVNPSMAAALVVKL